MQFDRSFFVVAMCLWSAMAHAAPPPAAADSAEVRFPCLTGAVLAKVKARRSLEPAAAACDAALASLLESRPAFRDLEAEERRVILATVVAYHWAPYGRSTERRFPQVLDERVLDCDNYAAVVGHLAQSSYLQYAGFDGDAVGNHAQLFYRRGDVRLLLDPTVGLIAAAGYNATVSGTPVAADAILRFRTRDEIADFDTRVTSALLAGAYTPRDILYFYDRLEDFVSKLDRDFPDFPTPGGANLRKRLPG